MSSVDDIDDFDPDATPTDELPAGWPPGLPDELYKAWGDPYRYCLKLRTGETFVFECLEFNGPDFVKLQGVETKCLPVVNDYFQFSRGLSVRVSDIVWVADCDS